MVDTRITDGALLLRLPGPADVDGLVAACQDPEIPRWTLVPSPYRRAEAEAWLEEARRAAVAGTALHLVVVDAAAGAGRVLGSVGLVELDTGRRCGEIGYWAAAEARGRGVVTRAVGLLRDHAVEELGFDRLVVHAHPGNAASQRVAERAGFVRTDERHAPERCGGATSEPHLVYRWSLLASGAPSDA